MAVQQRMSSEIHRQNYVTEYAAHIIITKKNFLNILLGVVAIIFLIIGGAILYEICIGFEGNDKGV